MDPRAENGVQSAALPKTKRLAKRAEFLRVYESGRKLFSRYSVLFIATNGLDVSRLGITATRKIGKATVRNRLKRWTREVYRQQRASLDLDKLGIDLVVNVKGSAADASFAEYRDDLVRVLGRVGRGA